MGEAFTFIDLFAGIGGIRLGFESVGGKCVFSSEFDDYARDTYQLNFGEWPAGDITKIDAKDIPDFDILLAGFPCQAFSIIGKKEGFSNETCGTLFFDVERILKEKQPKAFLLENVRNLVAHDNGNTYRVIISHLDAAGYKVFSKVLNALDYGVPQKRERIIIVGFKKGLFPREDEFVFPDPVPLEQRITLENILESDVDAKYYVNKAISEKRKASLKNKNYPKPYISHENMAGTITPHNYSSALRAGASANYILINDERRPTEREMLRIQGFPEWFKIRVNYTQAKKQCGNSVAVPVIKAVAKEMMKVMELSTIDNMGQITVPQAKEALDNVIEKSRVHLYKPIQIAEILYHHRTEKNIDLNSVEDYRTKSRKWRDDICRELLGNVCTSSARFQDNLFEQNAIPPEVLSVLGQENERTSGAVEAYIYSCFMKKRDQLAEALEYCRQSTKEDFNVEYLINMFWN